MKKNPKNETVQKAVTRTSAGLRDALFDEWDALNNGISSPQMAHAKAHLARQVIASVRAEIEFATHVRTGKPDQAVALAAPIGLSASPN